MLLMERFGWTLEYAESMTWADATYILTELWNLDVMRGEVSNGRDRG